jgi:hypothetical protein
MLNRSPSCELMTHRGLHEYGDPVVVLEQRPADRQAPLPRRWQRQAQTFQAPILRSKKAESNPGRSHPDPTRRWDGEAVSSSGCLARNDDTYDFNTHISS